MASASPGRRVIKDVLVALGARAHRCSRAARPQIAGKRKVELRGLDLVIAVDVSKSMLVDDVGPTAEMKRSKLRDQRLARARELATALIDELPGDRVGPVVFAGAAAHFPLTEDHQVAARFLYDLGPTDLPPGSNLAEVFRVSRCLLRPDLYDDLGCSSIGRRGHGGDPLRGESLDPQGPRRARRREARAAGRARQGDRDLHRRRRGRRRRRCARSRPRASSGSRCSSSASARARAASSTRSIRSPASGRRRRSATPDGKTVISKRDDGGMKAIAAAGGDESRYLIAPPTGEVDPMPIVEALRAVNRGLATKQVKEMRDVFQPFLFAALMLLVIEAAICDPAAAALSGGDA